MKTTILALLGTIGGLAASLFGGWDAAMTTLSIFVLIDYATGVIVAGVFHKSKKTETGSLKSIAGWKGLSRKGVTFLVVLLAHRIDLLIGTPFVRDGVIIAYIVNETISIIENAGLMGIPIPAVITRAIDVLKEKEEGKNNGD